ncbi:MAG: hypothetical protein MJ071_08610 [Oscillospiraceae bacterium]|nr:hypothetical protein [Oscillospiraceae bacterium]
MKDIQQLRDEAKDIGVFLPLINDLEPLQVSETLHNEELSSRAVLMMQAYHDGDAKGAPTEKTIERYQNAVRSRQYSIVYTEPLAISAESREYDNDLALTEETKAGFERLVMAIKAASKEAFGSEPLCIALLSHAGKNAVVPCIMEAVDEETAQQDPQITFLSDKELTELVIQCGSSAKIAEQAGFRGTAVNAADRTLFGESLAAFHRTGKFGGDFDDRSRFLRDCYTAMKMMTGNLIFSIRLSLSDGLPQPYGWGMAFEDECSPDLYEPALLLKILQALFDVQLVACSIGIPGKNWMDADTPETDLIKIGRLCTCIAMLDSDMQQNVYLIIPETESEEIPFENLAAGMILGEFASFGGYLG